jgi:hypothetical protein
MKLVLLIGLIIFVSLEGYGCFFFTLNFKFLFRICVEENSCSLITDESYCVLGPYMALISNGYYLLDYCKWDETNNICVEISSSECESYSDAETCMNMFPCFPTVNGCKLLWGIEKCDEIEINNCYFITGYLNLSCIVSDNKCISASNDCENVNNVGDCDANSKCFWEDGRAEEGKYCKNNTNLVCEGRSRENDCKKYLFFLYRVHFVCLEIQIVVGSMILMLITIFV